MTERQKFTQRHGKDANNDVNILNSQRIGAKLGKS